MLRRQKNPPRILMQPSQTQETRTHNTQHDHTPPHPPQPIAPAHRPTNSRLARQIVQRKRQTPTTDLTRIALAGEITLAGVEHARVRIERRGGPALAAVLEAAELVGALGAEGQAGLRCGGRVCFLVFVLVGSGLRHDWMDMEVGNGKRTIAPPARARTLPAATKPVVSLKQPA